MCSYWGLKMNRSFVMRKFKTRVKRRLCEQIMRKRGTNKIICLYTILAFRLRRKIWQKSSLYPQQLFWNIQNFKNWCFPPISPLFVTSTFHKFTRWKYRPVYFVVDWACYIINVKTNVHAIGGVFKVTFLSCSLSYINNLFPSYQLPII